MRLFVVQPPIGVSDFRKLIEYRDSAGNPYLFVDKSLFIKAILDDASEVRLIVRPRRFGKTLNMSMLQHFFSASLDNKPTYDLFKNLEISKYPQYVSRYQGKYPVISLTFKDIKSDNFEDAFLDLLELIRQVYSEHENIALSESSPLSDRDKRDYELILDRKAPDSLIKNALKNLTFYLSRCYAERPYVLIDEYDTPIQTAYLKNYYDKMVTLMREFLSAGLKDNPYLEKAILTGILRVSKESIFSGLNNLSVFSLLTSDYEEYFGFTDKEVETLLKKSNLYQNLSMVKDWYNGYQAGNTIIYNPWSIVNYIKTHGKLDSYWVNISDNVLIKELLLKSSNEFKAQFELLLQGQSTQIFVDEHITFNNLINNDSAIWSLLLMSGYLKARVIERKSQGAICEVQIPNKEVKDLYKSLITRWLSGVDSPSVFNRFIDNLLLGNLEDFAYHLQRILLQSFSVFDIKGQEPERFFHGFMLGLIAGIDPHKYQLSSNKESGYGRFDIAIIPKNKDLLGFIIEVKSIVSNSNETHPKTLRDAAKKALNQINIKQYNTIFAESFIKNYIKIGVAFSGKDLAVEYEKV